ncbi:MAG: glutathione S-transferase family protein [Polyangiales bacterium]
MLTVYDHPDSGNCYKVRLVLHQLNVPHRLVHIDSVHGETRTPAFLAMNPNGRVPLLGLPDGSYLPESNAIMHYLARDTPLVPADPLDHARMLAWLFFEQYSHEPYVAVARYIARHLPETDETRAQIARLLPKAHAALGVMEQHLADAPFFVGGRYGIADVALYAYTHRAEEGSVALAAYPSIRAWLARVEAEPGYVPML